MTYLTDMTNLTGLPDPKKMSDDEAARELFSIPPDQFVTEAEESEWLSLRNQFTLPLENFSPERAQVASQIGKGLLFPTPSSDPRYGHNPYSSAARAAEENATDVDRELFLERAAVDENTLENDSEDTQASNSYAFS